MLSTCGARNSCIGTRVRECALRYRDTNVFSTILAVFRRTGCITSRAHVSVGHSFATRTPDIDNTVIAAMEQAQ